MKIAGEKVGNCIVVLRKKPSHIHLRPNSKGKISSISSIDTGNYGNATFNISDNGTDENALTCFRSKYLNNEKFTSEDQIGVGDEVVICGKLVDYKGETPEFSGNVYIYSLNGKTE